MIFSLILEQFGKTGKGKRRGRHGVGKCTIIYETKLQKFSNLRELSKWQNSVIFSKFKKRKKLSPGKGLKKAYAKFEDDRAFRSSRKRRWKMHYI